MWGFRPVSWLRAHQTASVPSVLKGNPSQHPFTPRVPWAWFILRENSHNSNFHMKLYCDLKGTEPCQETTASLPPSSAPGCGVFCPRIQQLPRGRAAPVLRMQAAPGGWTGRCRGSGAGPSQGRVCSRKTPAEPRPRGALTLMLMPWTARSLRSSSHASSRGRRSRSSCRRASPGASPEARANCRTFSRKRTSSSTRLCRAAGLPAPGTP